MKINALALVALLTAMVQAAPAVPEAATVVDGASGIDLVEDTLEQRADPFQQVRICSEAGQSGTCKEYDVDHLNQCINIHMGNGNYVGSANSRLKKCRYFEKSDCSGHSTKHHDWILTLGRGIRSFDCK